jgi:hypothetical protein
MCRASCTWPEWRSLPKGPAGLPIVHGLPMTEDEYREGGWHSRGTYTTALGTEEHEWVAPLDRLQEAGRREHQRRERRIAEARTRREADDEWSAHVASMIEEETP